MKKPMPKQKRFSETAEKVFSGVRFSIYQWQQTLFDGTSTTFEIAKRADSVIIIPVIEQEIIMVKERQPHWEKAGIALVGGMVEEGEDPSDAARRELEEETGLVFEEFHLVDVSFPTPGVEWGLYTFVAKGYRETKEKKLDPGEENELVRVSFDEAIRMAKHDEYHFRPLFIEHHIVTDKIDVLYDIFMHPESHSLE